MTATVSVRGTGSAYAKPDRAEMTLHLSALHASTSDALEDVAARSERLAAVLDRFDIAPNDRVTYDFTVRPAHDWVDGARVFRGYRAEVSALVRVRDTRVVGALTADVTRDADPDIEGPNWCVEDDNPAHTDARKAATAAVATSASRRAPWMPQTPLRRH
jgi:uncharacterized protein YggE